MHKKIGYVFVWPLCTRIMHWIIASSFTLSFLSAFNHSHFKFHIAFGYAFSVMLFFRIIWGFVGSHYSTFSAMKFSIHELKYYFVEKIHHRWRKIPAGHNPASSWFTIMVLFLGSFSALSGIMLYGIQEGSGLLRGFNTYYFTYSYIFFDIHKYLSYTLFIFSIVHIIGVLIEQFYHKTDMVLSMIWGYKKSEGEDVKISYAQHYMAYGAIFISIGMFSFALSDKDNFLTQRRFQSIDFQKENVTFYEKCGNCHKNYPPFMLPHESWRKVLNGLDNHFGEKITENNISKIQREEIKSYLFANSAEHSTQKIAFKTLSSLGDIRPLSITKAPYWREAHRSIDAKIFKSPHVKDKSNCFVCHIGFEHGIFDTRLIKIPTE